jgi:hypothetical protein
MDDFVHPLGQQGRYRLVALSRQPQYSADDVRAYAVTTLAGDCLREEPVWGIAMDRRAHRPRCRLHATAPAPTLTA